MVKPYVTHVMIEGQKVLGLDIQPNLPGRGTVDLRLNLSPLKDGEQLTQGLALVLEDLTETHRLEAQQRIFERMVPPAVIEQINSDSLHPGGQRREITTLFADLRGFTSLSEKVEPEDLVAILNRYLGAAAECVLNESGTVDKFLGDAIMAWFNAPIPQADHTMHAVKAALGLREAAAILNKEIPGHAQMSFGVGINVGDAVLGLIGSEKRLDYTAIGDSVNTARRIQENAGPGQILVSRAAYERLQGRVVVGEVIPIRAYGKRDPVVVVEILRLKESSR
jgi:class 3 adenylate cyclase